MKFAVPQNLKTEFHPFRQIAVSSFIKGGLSILLGIILLLTVKSDFNEGSRVIGLEKILAGLGFIILGGRSLWRGYQHEYDFNLDDVYNPQHNTHINDLLGQRHVHKDYKWALAKEYSRIIHSRAFSLDKSEKGQVKDWQFIFYKMATRKKVSKLFDYVPYPITNFIANQSRPVAIIGFFLLLLISFLFITYLGLLSLSITWVNLFILTGLLSLFRPVRIDNLFKNDAKEDVRNKILFFLIFYIITLSLFKSYTNSINILLLFAILVTAAVIIYTALLSFQLIELVFSKREQTSIKVSSNMLKTFHTATQPNSIFQQFNNRISEVTGQYFFSPTTKDGDEPSGGQKTKGKFELEYLYETYPTIISTKYDDYSEKKLFALWRIGTGLFCIGLIAIFIGMLKLPGVDPTFVRYHPTDALTRYSPGMFTSLFFILFGLAIFFFGNKLVYEVYFFFNTEIFFESNLILFKADGNYDEYEDTQGSTKRKDTFTTFTPNIKVCKITSSIFIHPYLPKERIQAQPRFLITTEKNDVLFQTIYDGFKKNMSVYSGTFHSDTSSTIEIEDTETQQLE